MTLEFITNFINKKICENQEILTFTFYELRVKSNLSEQETQRFLELAQIRLKNLGYSTYTTGEQFVYENTTKSVKENELMVAIKNRGNEE